MSNRVKECLNSLCRIVRELAALIQDEAFAELCASLADTGKAKVDESSSEASMLFANMSPLRPLEELLDMTKKTRKQSSEQNQNPAAKHQSSIVSVKSDNEFKEHNALWTQEQINVLINGVQKGLSWTQLSAFIGRTEDACRVRYRSFNKGNTKPTSVVLWDSEQDQILIQGRANGLTWSEISNFLGNHRTPSACETRWSKLKSERKLSKP